MQKWSTKLKNVFCAIAIAAFLVGCVSIENLPKGYNGPVSQITDTYESVSSTRAYFFELALVDGRNVYASSTFTASQNQGKGARMEIFSTGRPVPSKESVLHLRGVTHVAMPILALGGKMYSVSGDITVSLEAGKEYFVKGELSNQYSAVWLEDSEGNIVSEKIESRGK